MAIRNVDTEMWNDAKVSENFTRDDLLFWLFLLTTRYSNFAGCFEITPRQMQIDLKYANVEPVTNLIDRFENEHKLIAYDYETHEILIFNWLKYNVNTSPNHKLSVKKYADKIKNQSFKSYIYDVLDKGLDRGYIGAYMPLKDKIKDKDNIKVKNKDKEDKELLREKKLYGVLNNVMLKDDEFEKLTIRYPYHYQEYIDKVSTYIASRGDKYKSHYATVLTWLQKDGVVVQAQFDEEGNLLNG